MKKLQSPVRNMSQDYLGRVLKKVKGQSYRHRPQRTEKSEAIKEYALRSDTALVTKIQDKFIRKKIAALRLQFKFKKGLKNKIKKHWLV